jgi:hypothetical protein
MTLTELRNNAGLGQAAMQKFEEASKMTKQAAAHRERLKSNVMAALEDPELGLSREQIKAEFEKWYLKNYIEPETLSQEEKYRRELEELKQSREDEKREREESQKTAAQRESDHRELMAVQKEIINILETQNLPKNRFTANRIVFYMAQNEKHNYNATPEYIAQQVNNERKEIVRAQFENSTAEDVIELLGPGILKILRQFDMGNVQRALEKKTGERMLPPGERQPREQKRRTMADVDEYFNRMRRERY